MTLKFRSVLDRTSIHFALGWVDAGHWLLPNVYDALVSYGWIKWADWNLRSPIRYSVQLLLKVMKVAISYFVDFQRIGM